MRFPNTFHFVCYVAPGTHPGRFWEPKQLPKLRGLCSGGNAAEQVNPSTIERSVPNPHYESNNNFVQKERRSKRSKRSMSNLDNKYSRPSSLHSESPNINSTPNSVYSKSNNYNKQEKNIYSKLSRNDNDNDNYSHLKADRHRKTKRKTPVSSRRLYNNDTYVDIP